MQTMLLKWKQPVMQLVKPATQPDYWYWAEITFWVGVFAFTVRFLVQLFSLYKMNLRSKPAMIDDLAIKIIEGDAGPFSFWQNIYINPDKHTQDDLHAILQHEQVHVEEWHVLDVLLAEISTIFYWFNPGVWLIKKAIKENLEFITDRKIVQQGIDRKAYQYSLLSVGLATTSNSIVNNFNLSTIKKRIIMMNTQQSSRLNLTRYTFVLPVITILLLFTVSMTDFARPITLRLIKIANPVVKSANAPLTMKEILTQSKKELKPIIKIGAKHDTLTLTLTKDVQLKADSMIFFINGKKGNLSKVNPDEIEHMYILKGNEADQYVDEKVGDHVKVVIIITKGSEEGKSLQSKLGEKYGETTSFKGLKMNVPVIMIDTAVRHRIKELTITGFQTSAHPVKVVTGGYYKNGDSIFVRGKKGKPLVLTITKDKLDTITAEAIRVNGLTMKLTDSIQSGMVPLNLAKKIQADVMGRVVYATALNIKRDNTYKLTDKLILIDGKEATEKRFKKLSAADIESMTFKSDIETKKTIRRKRPERRSADCNEEIGWG